jgi:hypothetical protein
MRFAQESVKLQFDNDCSAFRAGAREVITGFNQENTVIWIIFAPKYAVSRIRVAAWCLESRIRPTDSGDVIMRDSSGCRKSAIPA